ncbi:MAG: bifunctional biotin--[acetyl-CoA-carboxylase] ligase/biotin operon repressor BirA [Endozoicomonadaceae bacterium]|nr:bifunctional biotin--[acetyl-CoA-carboxylase] ligase/biotin operon repressor BirA [Endozoicomonadaceae bacterium]
MWNILTLLQDGKFHSGEKLGDALGVSRAAVWKRLKQLEKQGLVLDAVRGKGYRLSSDTALLDSRLIRSYIDASIQSRTALVVLHSAASTNDSVLLQINSPEPIQICIAEHQTAGRGRRGKSWISPLGANIYFSVLWRFDSGLSGLDGLSLVVGLTVLETLRQMGAEDLELKWPNDILCRGRKLAGILLEINGDLNGECQVVIGIGINVKLRQAQLDAITQPATDVCHVMGRSVDKNQIVGELIKYLVSYLDQFQEQGFAPFRERWQAYDAYVGKCVRLITGDKEITGIAAGVSEQGGFRLDRDGEIESFFGGEVSLRSI